MWAASALAESRGPLPAPHAPVGARVGRGSAPRSGGRDRGRRPSHAASLVLTDESVRSLTEREDEPAPGRPRSPGAARGLRDGTSPHRDHHAPHARHESSAVRASRLHRPATVPGLTSPRRAVVRSSGRCSSGFDGARPRLRARGSPRRSRRTGQPRAPRSGCELARDRERLPFSLDELLAARPDAQGPRPRHDRRRPAGARSMSGFLALEDGTVFRGRPSGEGGPSESRLHDRDDRLPRGRDGYELRGEVVC